MAGGGAYGLRRRPDGSTEEPFRAVTGKIDQTIAAGTVAIAAKRRTKITGGTGTLPTLTATNNFVIVELAPANGVTVTVARNSQTIDGVAADDTFVGDGGPGPTIRYDYVSAGVVTSRLMEGIPA